MSVGGVSNDGSAASYRNSPAVRFAQLQGAALGTLFGDSSGKPSELVSFSAAAAMPLFQRPGLLTGLTGWDGSMTTGSQRAAAAAGPPPKTPAPVFAFNPFDQASWWRDPKGSAIDTTA
jgi:hypothetical protein